MAFKVYYVDDEADLCENFIDAFSSDQIKIVCFTDPKSAIEAIKAAPPDYLFLDYRMPGMNGVELAQRLSPDFPIVLITGEINLQTNFPFLKILSKPYSFEAITSLIHEKMNEKAIKVIANKLIVLF